MPKKSKYPKKQSALKSIKLDGYKNKQEIGLDSMNRIKTILCLIRYYGVQAMDSVDILYQFLCLNAECDKSSYEYLVENFEYYTRKLYPEENRVNPADLAQQWLLSFYTHPNKKTQICSCYEIEVNYFIAYLKLTFRNFTINYFISEFGRRAKEDVIGEVEEYADPFNLAVAENTPDPADSHLYEEAAKVIDSLIRSLPESRVRAFLNSVRNKKTDDRRVFLEEYTLDNIYQLTSRMRKQLINLLDANEVSYDDLSYYVHSGYCIKLREDYKTLKK